MTINGIEKTVIDRALFFFSIDIKNLIYCCTLCLRNLKEYTFLTVFYQSNIGLRCSERNSIKQGRIRYTGHKSLLVSKKTHYRPTTKNVYIS